MKKTILFLLMIIAVKGYSQLPYFQQDHTSATAGVNYDYPVDAHYDGGTTVYSYHNSNIGNIVTKYNSASGTVIDVVGLFKGGVMFNPVRVRTFGGNYYALFNIVISGTSRFCIASLNATTNTLNYAHFLNNSSNNIDQAAVDFTFDTGTSIYVLSNSYDVANNQTDLCITRVNRIAGAIMWNNRYQNISRDEFGSNIIYRGPGQIYASAVTVNTTSFLDRATMLLQVNMAGNYVNSRMYRYSATCTGARVSTTWVMNAPANLFISSTSYIGADGNGPIYLAKIDPTTLLITMQKHYTSGTAYLNPEIQGIQTSAGPRILMSGNASFANTANPGYVHLFFVPGTLNFSSGTLYNTTFSGFINTSIFDAYTGNSAGFNIFSIAHDQSNTANYYVLKTSDLGDNGCDLPYNIAPAPCVIDNLTMSFSKVIVPANFPKIKFFQTANYANSFVESCFVTCPGCAFEAEDTDMADESENNKTLITGSSLTEGISVYPNPAKEMINIESDIVLENARIRVFNLLGETMLDTQMEGTLRTLDISPYDNGVYIVHILTGEEEKIFRIIKQ